MATKKRAAPVSDGLRVKGMFHVQIEEGGEIVGDSGWKENQITNLGFADFICGALGGTAGSSQIGYLALGTGGAPAASDTTLAGEITGSTKRQSTSNSVVSSKTLQMLGTFSSSNSFLAGSSNISNVGLYASTQTTATLFAGNTYSSSACATNQNVNVTYQIIFS